MEIPNLLQESKSTTIAIHSELVSMYELDVLALSTVKKDQKRFSEGRRDLFDDPRPGRPLTHALAAQFTLYFKGDHSLRAGFSIDTLGLEKPRAHEFFTTSSD
jgi:hypothetical protein